MITNIYLDCECIPNEQSFMFEQAARDVKVPSTYTKPDTIAKWWEEKGPAAMRNAQHALGLQPPYARIVALSWAIEDHAPTTYYGDHERVALECFFQDLAEEVSKLPNPWSLRFVGHNIVGFDLPLIWWAAMRNNVAYSILPNPRKVKPWETVSCVDTLYHLSGGNSKGYGLANMCKLFGIKSALPDMDGSQVWDKWQAGEQQLVADYCEDDVRLVRDLHKRIKEWL